MLTSFLADLKIAAPVTTSNLTVFPLCSDRKGTLDFVTLNPDTPHDLFQVSEVSEAGSVPELRLENLGDMPLLVIDGQELVGARQNRMVNLSIMVKPREPVHIPVSCVEQGRWSYRSRNFAAAPRTAFPELRLRKLRQVSMSLASTGNRMTDQGDVWDSIASKADRMHARSETAAMAEIFESRADRIKRAQTSVELPANAVGAAFAIGSQLVGIEVVANPACWQEVFPTILSGYVVEAMDRREISKAGAPALEEVLGFISGRVTNACMSRYPAIGAGIDIRLEGEGVCGAALSVSDEIIHLCAFAGDTHARMAL